MRDTLTVYKNQIPDGFPLDLRIDAQGIKFFGGDYYAGHSGEVAFLWGADIHRVGLVYGADAHYFDAATLDDALTLAGALPEWDREVEEDGDAWAREVLDTQRNTARVNLIVAVEGRVIDRAVVGCVEVVAIKYVDAPAFMTSGKVIGADDLPKMRRGATPAERLAHIDQLDTILAAQKALAPGERDAPLIDTAIFAVSVLSDLDPSYEVQVRAADVYGAHIDWTQGVNS